MRIKDKNYSIDELLRDADFSSYHLNKIGNFYLTNEEIAILDRCFIDYKSCKCLNDLRILIENILEEEDIDSDDANELDYVLSQIAERHYYQETRK